MRAHPTPNKSGESQRHRRHLAQGVKAQVHVLQLPRGLGDGRLTSGWRLMEDDGGVEWEEWLEIAWIW